MNPQFADGGASWMCFLCMNQTGKAFVDLVVAITGIWKEVTMFVTDEGRPLTPSGRIKRPCAWKITEWLSTKWDSLPHDTIVCVFKKCLISNDFNGARMTSSWKTAVKHFTSDDDNNDERQGNYSSKTGLCSPPSL